jgi:hypothetical protein
LFIDSCFGFVGGAPVLRDSLFACLVVVSIACCVYIVALEWLLIGS